MDQDIDIYGHYVTEFDIMPMSLGAFPLSSKTLFTLERTVLAVYHSIRTLLGILVTQLAAIIHTNREKL